MSEAAARAMHGAATVLGAPRTALVVFVYFPASAAVAGADAVGTPIISDDEAEDVLELGVRTASEAGFDATGRRIASTGTAARAIAAAAEEHDARLLVLGQPRRSAINRFLLGSVAREVLSAQHRPVVLVGSAERTSPADAPGTRGAGSDGPVLICWDGSEGAARAIEDAAEIVGPGRRATVLFAEIIAATADSEGSLLITMGQRERSAIGTLVLGSVARGVLEEDHRPVLLSGPSHPGVYPRSRS